MSPEASRITGIEDAILAGQPTIERVLPAFRDFCEDTVLVAHNAAFDMRFLRLKEEVARVSFAQPVLDTLLLSAVLHPDLESHGLEAIAERMGIRQMGRHTALGDAIMTAEIFLRMVPLLAQQGIRTLAQAREAAQKTYFARIDY
jgi:DNA polymerase-3 subunit epsilon